MRESTKKSWNNLSVVAGVALVSLAIGSSKQALALEGNINTRVTNPSTVSVEVAGRALLYSINFDRVLSENISAGLGLGTVGMTYAGGTSANVSATIMPFYGNYYFIKDAGSPFVTAGINLVMNSNSVQGLTSNAGNLQFSSSPIQATFGAGYEYRSDNGYLFRITGYGLYAGKNFAPWLGVGLGYSF